METTNRKIETKMVHTNDHFRCVYINESFGWRYSQSITYPNGDDYLIFQREILNTEEYKQIINNENEYYNLTFKRHYEEGSKFNVGLFILLFILGVIGAIIYVIVFFTTKDKPSFSKEDYENGIKDFWRKSNILLWESRRLSFGSKNTQLLDYSKIYDNDAYDDVRYYKEGTPEIKSYELNSTGRHYGGYLQIYGDEHSINNKHNGSSNKKMKFNIPLFILLFIFYVIPAFIYLGIYFSKNKKK